MENSKTNQPQKFVLNLPQKIDLRNWEKNMLLFKTCLFIASGKIKDNSTKTIKSK